MMKARMFYNDFLHEKHIEAEIINVNSYGLEVLNEGVVSIYPFSNIVEVQIEDVSDHSCLECKYHEELGVDVGMSPYHWCSVFRTRLNTSPTKSNTCSEFERA